MAPSSKNPLQPFFDILDMCVELFLVHVIAPFLVVHEQFYKAMNTTLRQMLDAHAVPTWFTANFITYARTALVVPTLLLLAYQHTVLPALLVLLVDFGDFLDGVVARYWRDAKKEDAFGNYTRPVSSSYGGRPTT